MITTEPLFRLEQRFDILREIIATYRARLTEMESEVVQLFASSELAAIADCILEKQRIERLAQQLEQFVLRWELEYELGID
ncbi:hypothetical protein ACI7RC_17980 [Brevibacillus sp. B_LB10_24]|uniref:hypothetical protein n=1 Tax=Brevibacillus sp. B_LB10_24 TaxID=3380645 RepID=UPI0038BA43A5